jgi:gluconolactonase
MSFETIGHIERLDPRLDALLAPGTVIEKVADGLVWAEGPVWDTRTASLLFSDVPRNTIFRWRPDDGVTLAIARSGYSGPDPPPRGEPGSNGLTFDREGRLVLCQHGDRRVARRERDGSLTMLADRFQGKRLNSPNDLAYHPGGDLYFTDPVYGLPGGFEDPGRELDFQGVFRLAADGELHAVVADLPAPNGIAFSLDGRVLYVSNSQRSRPVWMAYDVGADGRVSNARQFAEASAWVHPSDNVPDGMKVDRHGNLFATGPGGVHVFAPDGTRLGRIVVGVPLGNVAWGPDGMLFIAANHWLVRVQTRTGAP